MRIQIASDLHLDFLQRRFPDFCPLEPADADLLVIAGDIHAHTGAIATFHDWPAPVIYVHGNHEPYDAHYDDLVLALRQAADDTRIHYLECDETVHEGVRILGCCLWTDYRLMGDDTAPAMQQAQQRMYDYRRIRTAGGLLTPDETVRMHVASRRWLHEKLEQHFPGPTVVVTHHAPHPGSIHPRFAGSLVNAAFVSDLTALMGKADLWIHGHTHDSFDYQVRGTRIVANPRGYPLNLRDAATPQQIEWENKLFDPRLVIDLPAG